jgi:hypothetical protein
VIPKKQVKPGTDGAKEEENSQLGTNPRKIFLELTSYSDGGKMDDETGHQHHVHRLPTQSSQSVIKTGIHTIKRNTNIHLKILFW